MIDTHCHVDLYDAPLDVANEAEAGQINTIAVTYLPTHFRLAQSHLRTFHHVKPALGLHPLAAADHEKELGLFRDIAREVEFVGEIGLDFSSHGLVTRAIQEDSFVKVLDALRGRQCFITLHSRQAEDSVLGHLKNAGSQPVAFHWFTGSRAQLRRVLDAGHSVSLNPAMIRTAKWREFIHVVPRDSILTETDGPFTSCENRKARPTDILSVIRWIAERWKCSAECVEQKVSENFARMRPLRAENGNPEGAGWR
ncbi:MAG TPA: TatD family hydrolase [Chthoniobacterales bacterium]|nr:TatD family hydrolase [Chthoniobacterales bacterium]